MSRLKEFYEKTLMATQNMHERQISRLDTNFLISTQSGVIIIFPEKSFLPNILNSLCLSSYLIYSFNYVIYLFVYL